LAVMIAPGLLGILLPPVAAAVLVLAAPAALAWRAAGHEPAHALPLDNPFDLSMLLRFTGLLAVIMLLARLVATGPTGLLALGGFSGLLDVDPVTLSMARMTHTGLMPMLAAMTILVAGASNGLAKSVLAVVFGGWRLGLTLSALALAAFAAGTAAWFVSAPGL